MKKPFSTAYKEGNVMNVPIRIIGSVTSVFWVLLVAFIALAAFSIKDLSFDFGEPQFGTTPNGDLGFSLPLYLDNRGYYSLKDFHLTTVLSDGGGAEISRDNTYVPVIPRGESVTILHNVTLSLVSLLEKGEQYLFNDINLNVSVTAGLNFADLLPAEISKNFTFPWGAPFHNFALGKPSYEQVDSTQVMMVVPLSFENHAAFDLSCNIRMELYDFTESLSGKSQTKVYVSQQSVYEGKMEFSFPQSASSLSAAQSGHFIVYFDIGFAEYGPLVISYG